MGLLYVFNVARKLITIVLKKQLKFLVGDTNIDSGFNYFRY